ncbi:jg24495 [Pararge aegeria aegeria]|uniref:Jg24495 protein n=1 Tax=Pararge aegeria aegeria TaxID=348720 RepID=A0A8S4RES1_9NEOP|nr:jg24495 [Pararge aegeria aegeria]
MDERIPLIRIHQAEEGTTRTPEGDDNDGSDPNAGSSRGLSAATSREEDDDSSNNASNESKSPGQRRPIIASSSSSSHKSMQDTERPASDTDKRGHKWRHVQAVMAYYQALRKIKRFDEIEDNGNAPSLSIVILYLLSNKVEPKMDEAKDNGAAEFSDPKETTIEERRFLPKAVFDATNSRNSGNCESQYTILKPRQSLLFGSYSKLITSNVEDTGSEGATGEQRASNRKRRRKVRVPRTVVNPDENFYFYWLWLITICVLYNLWTLIVRQSFPELQIMCHYFWLTCDGIGDVVFALDLVVQLRTGYLEQGLMVYDSKKLAKHYLASRPFLLDIAALTPLDLIQLKIGTNPIIRFPRFLKVYRAVSCYYIVESRTVYPNFWRVINLIHILLILAHWFGCFYFLLSEAEGFQGDWAYPHRPGDYATLTRKYLGSLYWSTLTLTTIGDLPTPETNAE